MMNWQEFFGKRLCPN